MANYDPTVLSTRENPQLNYTVFSDGDGAKELKRIRKELKQIATFLYLLIQMKRSEMNDHPSVLFDDGPLFPDYILPPKRKNKW